jgi:hypothetical protein
VDLLVITLLAIQMLLGLQMAQELVE